MNLVKNFKESSSDLLIYFCKYGQSFDSIKLLVENGADVHAQNDYALILASDNGHYDYALILASKNGHLKIVKYLVEKGADIHANDGGALRFASVYGHLEVVKYLKKFDKNQKNLT